MARYWDHCFWLLGWFGEFNPILVSVCWITMQKQTLWELLTHQRHTSCTQESAYILSHMETHTHSPPSLTCIHTVICQTSLLADRLIQRPEDQTCWRKDTEREVLQVKQILWLNCSFSIAFVQYWLKKKKKLKNLNFYFISQSSRWGQLYRRYRVNMALRHLIVGLPNSFCK